MASGVYAITNTRNDHRYIGSAVNMGDRWSQHHCLLRKGIHHSSHLARAWAKYGESAFRFTVLEECEPEELVAIEQSWMDTLQPEYNTCPTAGSQLGYCHTDETRAKLSASHMGQKAWNKGKKMPPLSPEAKANLSTRLAGHTVSEATRAKISASHIGIKPSPETRARLSAMNVGKMHSVETRQRMSASQKGKKSSLGTRIALHKRWHVKRGITNPECPHCKAANP